MGNVNVTEVLADPDFTDPIQLVTRTSKINSKGENIISENVVKTYGSVQPASGKVINRLPEALRVVNVSSFWVLGKIIASEPGKYSSVLVFNGQRYQVQSVDDWSNWGAGWSEGTCVAEVPA